MIMNDKATYTLWHFGDLIATGPHTRETFDDFIAEGMQMVENCPDGTAEIFSSRDDRVWHFEPQDLKKEEAQPFDGWEGCWAGDGSGMDDLADFNAMEGCDY